MTYTIYPKPLSGIINAPASKSVTHRVLICAAFSDGVSTIHNALLCDDTILTMNALKAIGTTFEINDRTIIVHPAKNFQDNIPIKAIECDNSGSTLRFLIPLFGSLYNSVAFHGSSRLMRRISGIDLDRLPMDYTFFEETLSITRFKDFKEVTISDNNTSQFISGLLMASAISGTVNTIHILTKKELNPYIILTLDVIAKFGVQFTLTKWENSYTIIINEQFKNRTFNIQKQKLKALDITIEGDYSSAANFIAMGLLGNRVIIKDLEKDSHQGDRKFLSLITEMNGKLEIGSNAVSSTTSDLLATTIDLTNIPDLGPLLMGLACVASGTTIVKNFERLELKESNRIDDTINILTLLGGKIFRKDNQIIIEGQERLLGGVTIDPKDDHRLVMMCAALTSKYVKRIEILNAECVNKSFPDFWELYRKIEGIALTCNSINNEGTN